MINEVYQCAEWQREDGEDERRSISSEYEQNLLQQKSNLNYAGVNSLGG